MQREWCPGWVVAWGPLCTAWVWGPAFSHSCRLHTDRHTPLCLSSSPEPCGPQWLVCAAMFLAGHWPMVCLELGGQSSEARPSPGVFPAQPGSWGLARAALITSPWLPWSFAMIHGLIVVNIKYCLPFVLLFSLSVVSDSFVQSLPASESFQ